MYIINWSVIHIEYNSINIHEKCLNVFLRFLFWLLICLFLCLLGDSSHTNACLLHSSYIDWNSHIPQIRYISNTGVYGFSILRYRPGSSTVQINTKVNQTNGQSKIDNSDKLATLGIQDAGRRQTKNKTKQNK